MTDKQTVRPKTDESVSVVAAGDEVTEILNVTGMSSLFSLIYPFSSHSVETPERDGTVTILV